MTPIRSKGFGEISFVELGRWVAQTVPALARKFRVNQAPFFPQVEEALDFTLALATM